MKVINLSESHSMLGNYIAQIRDKSVQKDRVRFRFNLERIGRIFGYEISKQLAYSDKEVVTPLGTATVPTCDSQVLVCSILRAGLPLHKGLLDVFDEADSAFVAAFRKYYKGDEFHIKVEYSTQANLNGKVLILADTLLATGQSIEITLNRLFEDSTPVYTHLVCPVSSVYAVEYLQKRLPYDNITLWTAGIDEELTAHSYVVPGLGDAGDLAFGEKL
ncbi:MAG: uracil phosphoribosyltransferase [Bacteroidales bacterium]|nr:uracil phosphoribosyltransferase [Bacteroidales bacterium]